MDEVNERGGGGGGRRGRNLSFSNAKTTSGTYVMNSSYSTPPSTGVHRSKRSNNQTAKVSNQQSRRQQQQQHI